MLMDVLPGCRRDLLAPKMDLLAPELHNLKYYVRINAKLMLTDFTIK